MDAFTNARNFLFDEAESRPPLSPVRYPTLWDLGARAWLHWDGNTNSVLERNVGQALGVGALADPASDRSTILPGNLHALEQLARKLTPPKWPAAFGAVAWAGADFRNGKDLYAAHCAAFGRRTDWGNLPYSPPATAEDELARLNAAR